MCTPVAKIDGFVQPLPYDPVSRNHGQNQKKRCTEIANNVTTRPRCNFWAENAKEIFAKTPPKKAYPWLPRQINGRPFHGDGSKVKPSFGIVWLKAWHEIATVHKIFDNKNAKPGNGLHTAQDFVNKSYPQLTIKQPQKKKNRKHIDVQSTKKYKTPFHWASA